VFSFVFPLLKVEIFHFLFPIGVHLIACIFSLSNMSMVDCEAKRC